MWKSCLSLGSVTTIVVNVESVDSYFKLQICGLRGYYMWDLTQKQTALPVFIVEEDEVKQHYTA